MSWPGLFLAQSDAQTVHTNSTMQMVLWIGMLVLCLTFLVMTWTRLGRARPLTKCLTLSVFAHVLIGVLFYGTRILGIDFPLAGSGSNAVSFIDDERLLAAVEHAITDDVTSTSEEFTAPFEENDMVVPMPEQVEPVPMPDITPNVEEPMISSAADAIQDAVPDATDDSSADSEADTQATSDGIDDSEMQAAELPDGETDTLPMDVTVPSAPMENPVIDTVVEPDTTETQQQEADVIEVPQSVSNSNLVAVKTEVPKIPENPVVRTAKRMDDAQLPEVYKKRWQSKETRGRGMGASSASEHAVESALAWLAANQDPSGRWIAKDYGGGREPSVQGKLRGKAGLNADTGITGLALLAFMGAGETHLDGEYRKTVQRGLEWLLGQQAGDGNLSGKASLYARMYCHAMATMAVCEALALTGDARMRPYAQRAIDYTISSQDKLSGGWRYQPQDTGDMSQCGWQLLAIRSAELAGLKVSESVRANMIRFVNSCDAGTHGGLSSYRPDEKITATMTAEAMACRIWLDHVESQSQLNEAVSRIMQELPGESRWNLYLNYYGSFVLKRLGGEKWQTWNQAMQNQLLSLQRTASESELQKSLAGSWDPTSVWGGYGGRVYSTALAVLCLEVYYRFD